MKDLSKLEERIGCNFKNPDLLQQAMVHRSYLNEHADFPLNHNERLEFLGDAVLEIVVTEYLFEKYPETSEGDLTDWRASLVNAKMLATVAKEIGIEKYLYLSKGEAKDTNSKARQYILANAMEALIGAIYLDQGINQVKKFIADNLLFRLNDILSKKLYIDPKSRFQEKAQEIYGITPSYRVLSELGPDHNKIFEVGLYLNQELIATGKGSSKQEAQTKAAETGLKNKGWQK